MTRILAAFLLALTAFFSCRAQRPADNKTLLWRISGKGLAKPSYLFGTIHLLCPNDYLWTDAMRAGLAQCSTVCFELDMDDPAVLTQAATGLMDTSGKMLREYFTPAEYKRLAAFMRDTLGTNVSSMQMMKPMVLETILASKTVDCLIPVSYEGNIMLEAQKAGKDIIGLESVQEQLDVFNHLAEDTLVSGLMEMIDSFSKSRQEYARLVDAYKTQDLPRLFQLLKSSKELGEDLGPFLDDRNKKWVPRMEPVMKAKPTFFAVGAGHLPGAAGVIELLRHAGYTVAPVH